MPCFNAGRYVADAVESIMLQQHTSVELIVIDDGSSDESWDILSRLKQKHPNIVLLQQANAGPYPARNYGLSKARGNFIAFLDADDYWDPRCLEKLYQTLVSANADVAYCGWQNIVEQGESRPPYVPPDYQENNLVEMFLQNCPWPIHAALIRRDILDRVEGFSTRHFSSMDYDLWLRIAAVTRRMVRVPETLAFYRWHDSGQISSVKWRQAVDAWHARKDFIRNNPELVADIPVERLRELSDGSIAKKAYEAFWMRDLVSAQHLFRFLLRTGYWKMKDLKYILPSLLPGPLYRGLVQAMGS
jgi:glycosyltransferase involved in cell wall biosynthesis